MRLTKASLTFTTSKVECMVIHLLEIFEIRSKLVPKLCYCNLHGLYRIGPEISLILNIPTEKGDIPKAFPPLYPPLSCPSSHLF